MEIVDQIRQTASIVEIASQYTTLRRRGNKHVGLCPFHSEKTPSFTVDDEKQLFHCFGCGAGGDIFTLVMERENLSFPEALKYLAEKYNIPLPKKREFSPQLQKLEEQLFKINENTLAFFKKNLFTTKEGEKALEYLKKRDISEEIIQKLKIGYALNSWDSLLSFFKEKKVTPKLLEKAGLVLYNQKKDSYYDRFRGRIIFPIFGLTGKVVAFGGRSILNADPKYLNSPDTPVYSKGKILYGLNFSKESIRDTGEVIIVEGYTDFVSLYQAGITNIAASLGTSLTSDQVSQTLRFAPKIIINYDGDSAGKLATSRGISLYFEKASEPEILILPENLDPDSYLRKYGTDKYITHLKKGGIPLIKFLIKLFAPENGIKTVEEKINIATKIIEIILINPNTIRGSEYLKQVSEYLALDEQVVRDSIRVKQPRKESAEKSEGKVTFLLAEKRLLQILLEDKRIASYVFPEIKEEHFQGLKTEPIFAALTEYSKKGKEPDFNKLRQKIDPSLSSSLAKALLLEKEQAATVEEAFECLNALKQFSLENRKKELKAEIISMEKKGDKEKLRSLLIQRQDIINQLSSLSKRNYQNLSYNNRDISAKERN
ncbi:MAG: DNA primase [Candidatus Aminicenantes bacterium]|nr:MAG: DNA primase [Candidatus Aminicenantes bacterium]